MTSQTQRHALTESARGEGAADFGADRDVVLLGERAHDGAGLQHHHVVVDLFVLFGVDADVDGVLFVDGRVEFEHVVDVVLHEVRRVLALHRLRFVDEEHSLGVRCEVEEALRCRSRVDFFRERLDVFEDGFVLVEVEDEVALEDQSEAHDEEQEALVGFPVGLEVLLPLSEDSISHDFFVLLYLLHRSVVWLAHVVFIFTDLQVRDKLFALVVNGLDAFFVQVQEEAEDFLLLLVHRPETGDQT